MPELGALDTAGVVLFVMCLIGAFDIAVFHRPAKLAADREGRRETVTHVVRGFVYTAQLLLLPNVRFSGLAFGLLVALYLLDVGVAMVDVWLEPASRRSRGGLPHGEYLAHVVLSVLAGVYLTHVWLGTRGWMDAPTSIALAANMALPLRLALGVAGVGCGAVATYELFDLIGHALPEPAPIHVRVRVPVDRKRLWDVTQDHRLHPRWDLRFTRIEMLADEIEQGTEMRYERDLLGITVRGFGRYKHHRHLEQSTFEFHSEDPRSLIRRGVGLWLYRDAPDGQTELWTSYRYEVRWGGVGRVIDRFVFRPLMGWATGISFRTLARDLLDAPDAPVTWVVAKKPLAIAA